MTSQPGFVERVEARLRKFSEEHWGIYADSDAYSLGLVRQALTEILAESEPVAWHADGHLDDTSATTYSKQVAEHWIARGWSVTPMFTHPAPSELAEAQGRIAELEAKLESAEFWNGIYPEGWTKERVENEMHDFRALMNGIPELYSHITGGMCSKELTEKSVIISLHDDHVTQCVEEETADLRAELERAKAQSLDRLEGLAKCGMERDELRTQLAASDAALRESRANDAESMRQLAATKAALADGAKQIRSLAGHALTTVAATRAFRLADTLDAAIATDQPAKGSEG